MHRKWDSGSVGGGAHREGLAPGGSGKLLTSLRLARYLLSAASAAAMRSALSTPTRKGLNGPSLWIMVP